MIKTQSLHETGRHPKARMVTKVSEPVQVQKGSETEQFSFKVEKSTRETIKEVLDPYEPMISFFRQAVKREIMRRKTA